MCYLQRRKSIAVKARNSVKRKHLKEVDDLKDQLNFLKDENGDLNIKID